ncbi:GAF domain-containing sensor histidine kinase [Leptospira barantonii]|uniref:GAF domain-containing sensor histidine kinase n=1 Tax=Leptospira barantonii TaxID=2023184 RepID=UPI001FF00296|nr:GAF domain-containing sensor histidine kinase [Leptospira barantonii]
MNENSNSQVIGQRIWEQLSKESVHIPFPFFILDKDWRIVYSSEDTDSKYVSLISEFQSGILPKIRDFAGDLIEFTFETKIPTFENYSEETDVCVFIGKLQFQDHYCILIQDKTSSHSQDSSEYFREFRRIKEQIHHFLNIQDSKIDKRRTKGRENSDTFRVELLKKISLLDLMQQIATAANETKDIEALLQFAVDRICVVAGWKLGHIELLDEAESVFLLHPIWYSGEESSVKKFRSLIESLKLKLFHRVLNQKRTIWFEDFLENFDFNSRQVAIQAGINTAIAVPIWNGEIIVGVMEFFLDSEHSDPSLIEALSHVASQIGRAFERKNAETYLRKSQEQLRALSARLQEVREEERVLIAREIHDELGQILTVLKIEITLCKQNVLPSDSSDHKIIKDLDSMIQLVDSAIESTQRIATELRPLLLEELGLLEGIEWYGEEFQKRTGILCKVTKTSLKSFLNNEIAIALFRIFQETLTNVARHSKATSVDVVLEEKDSNIILIISDNGIGIQGNEISDSKSLGIIGMRERAIVLGGKVEILGSRENGTKVIVRIPIRASHSSSSSGSVI